MIQVVLVDDEPFMIELLKTTVAWEKYGMKVVGAFYNGQQALAFIQSHEVDVVISDIKMPVMDGKELLRELKKVKPSIEFVVLSAYNEFQLVREFFQMGIFDYITKIDLDSPQTAQVLSRLRLSVMKKSVGSNKDAVVEFLRASAIQRYPKADKMQFVLFNFSLSDKTNLQKFRKFTNFIQNQYEEISYEMNHGDTFLLLRQGPAFAKTLEGINAQLCKVPFKILAGYSRVNSLEKLDDMLEEARKAANFSFYCKEERAINALDVPYSLAAKAADLEMVNLNRCKAFFKENLSNTNLSRIIERMTAFFEIHRTWNLPYTELKGKVADLFIYLNHLLRNAEIIDRSLEENTQYIVSIIDETNSFEQLRSLILEYLEILHTNLQQEGSDKIIERIRIFVDQNFDQDLSLNRISKEFGISENYLSRLFTRENHVTFKQYVKSLRIAKAKDYLSNTTLRIGEICEKLGFHSMEHFSRLFKSETGLSPSEYRAAGGQKKEMEQTEK